MSIIYSSISLLLCNFILWQGLFLLLSYGPITHVLRECNCPFLCHMLCHNRLLLLIMAMIYCRIIYFVFGFYIFYYFTIPVH